MCSNLSFKFINIIIILQQIDPSTALTYQTDLVVVYTGFILQAHLVSSLTVIWKLNMVDGRYVCRMYYAC